MTGLTQVVSSQTTASTDDVLAVTLSREEASVGTVMSRMLSAFAAPAVLLYCAALKRIVGTTDGATQSLIADLWAGDAGAGFTVKPRVGSYGMAREFEVVPTPNRAAFNDADTLNRLANPNQRRTLSGLVNLADNLRYGFQPPLQPFDCLVSQLDSSVTFILSDGTLAAALPSLPASGQTVAIALKLKPTQFKTIFE